MKKTLVAVGIAAVLFLPVAQAKAHVLLTDQSGKNGAILHITPDDDPIAGQKAVLFLEVQSKLAEKPGAQVELTVKNDAGTVAKVATNIKDTLVSASYNFPAQGTYELTYKINAQGETYVFKETLRVSRGAAGEAQNESGYAWAEAAIVGSATGLAVLLIVAFNRRREIAVQSKM